MESIFTNTVSDLKFTPYSIENGGVVLCLSLIHIFDQIRSKFGTDIIKRASFLKKDSIVDHAASKQKHLSHSALKEDEKGSEGGGSGKVRDNKRGWNETY